MTSATLRGNPEMLRVNSDLTLVLFTLRATREEGRLLLADQGLSFLTEGHRRVLSHDPDLGRHQLRSQEIAELKRQDGDIKGLEAISRKERALWEEFGGSWFYKLSGKEWFMDDGRSAGQGFHRMGVVVSVLNSKFFEVNTAYKPDSYRADVIVGAAAAADLKGIMR